MEVGRRVDPRPIRSDSLEGSHAPSDCSDAPAEIDPSNGPDAARGPDHRAPPIGATPKGRRPHTSTGSFSDPDKANDRAVEADPETRRAADGPYSHQAGSIKDSTAETDRNKAVTVRLADHQGPRHAPDATGRLVRGANASHRADGSCRDRIQAGGTGHTDRTHRVDRMPGRSRTDRSGRPACLSSNQRFETPPLSPWERGRR